MKNTFTSKIIIYSCGFLVAIFAFYSFVSIKNDKPSPTTLVNVNVQFGRGPSCIGRGVCSIDEPGSDGGGNSLAPTIMSNNASGQFYTNSQGLVTLDIFKNSISVSTKEEQFANNIFEQIEELVLPNYLSSSAKIPGGFKIETGQYPVIDFPDKYTIQF